MAEQVGSTATDQINVWFALVLKKWSTEEVVE